jgi:hypothetical protein
MSELSKIIKEHLGKRLHNSELTNDEMVEIIDTVGVYLNLRTVANYATLENISYNGVLARIKSGKIKEYELFGVKFIIDNE